MMKHASLLLTAAARLKSSLSLDGINRFTWHQSIIQLEDLSHLRKDITSHSDISLNLGFESLFV